jgi:hypothetical protein
MDIPASNSVANDGYYSNALAHVWHGACSASRPEQPYTEAKGDVNPETLSRYDISAPEFWGFLLFEHLAV